MMNHYFKLSGKMLTVALLFAISCSKSTEPSVSRRIAFVRIDNGINHIFLMDVDANETGVNAKRLTSDSSEENYPTWSPDGKKLLYTLASNGSGIYIINADGTGKQRLSPTPGFDTTPSWSPDGKKIIYARLTGNVVPNQIPQTEIHIMNLDGTGDTTILPKRNFSVEPRWSVQNKIAFIAIVPDSTLQIFTMNINGSGLVQLTTQGNNGEPVWSPDGSAISFGSDREGNGKLNIFRMNSDGSSLQQLTHFLVPIEAGDTNWSSDGNKITFEYDINGKKQSDPTAYAEVWTMNSDGTNATSTHQPCSNVGCAPRWQPISK